MKCGAPVRLEIPSRLDMLDLVQSVGEKVARSVGLDDEGLHWLGIALHESLINAIRHGNREDPGKRVHVEFTPLVDDDPPGLAVRVRDEGRGFDPATIPDCIAPENLLKTSGRGIFLIRSFMDEFSLQRAAEGGMEMRMVKRVQHQRA
jgi:serine/threonine-protein kinase RsbW